MASQQRTNLRDIAADTINLCSQLEPGLARDAAATSHHDLDHLPRLDPARCPRHKPAPIKVVNCDTLTAAIKLGKLHNVSFGKTNRDRPLVMNFANRKYRGGGWRNGALAQEEAICYRSTLAMSLETAQYPLKNNEALYNPFVIVLREEMADGHRVIPEAARKMVAAVTAAALERPKVQSFNLVDGTQKLVFASEAERRWTKDKMRLTLRIAAAYEHELLVLGAFGCGVFANPPEDVAWCWKEVLGEHEFSGGWWKEVWFAIYDPSPNPGKKGGNLDTFQSVLDGLVF